jgi:hypothetical protein
MLTLFNPWMILGVVLTVLAAGAGGYVKGHRDADRSAEIAVLQTSLAAEKAARSEAERQALASRDIAEKAVVRQREVESDIVTMQTEIEEYARELQQAKSPCDCAADQHDVDRLRGIATPRPGTGSARPAGAPLILRPARPGALGSGR